MADFFNPFFDELRQRLNDVPAGMLHRLCDMLNASRDHKIIIAGNGGSAAISSHVSVDLVKMLGIRAQTFSDSDLITCFANDYGYKNWLAEAIAAYGDVGDTAILISSSGQSQNIINAANMAKQSGMDVVTLSGFKPDNPLRQLGDLNLYCQSDNYNCVENVHQIWLLAAIEKLSRG